MHCEFPGYFGTVVQCISRFCVPLFFMVSGYFSYRDSRFSSKGSFCLNDHTRKVKHIFIIILWASIIYFLYALIIHSIGTVSYKGIIIWAIFNQPILIPSLWGHLWFLYSLLYVYIAYAFIDKLGIHRIAIAAIPVLFIAYIVLAQGMHLFGVDIPNYLYRNWLLEGLPFFLLGYWLHKKEKEGYLKKFSNSWILAVIIIFTVLCIPERYLMNRDFGVNMVTIPQVTAIFCFAVNNHQYGKGIVQKIGKNLSMYIYVFHIMVWRIVEGILANLGLLGNRITLYFLPILVCVFTLLLSTLIYKSKKLIISRK